MKILYIYPIYSPTQKLISQYFLNDQKIMESEHEVRVCEFIYLLGILKEKHLGFFLKNLFELFKGVIWCDVTVSWFAKLHAFFAVLFCKLMGKKSVIIAGGEEATNTHIDGKPYGLYAHPIKKWFAWFMFRFADKIIAVSKYNMKEILENTEVDHRKVHLVYHGFDSNHFKKIPEIEKVNLVINVGNINEENYSRKGLKTFVESAVFLPDVEFYLVGPALEGDNTFEKLKTIAPQNVVFTGGVYGEDLIKLLCKASVYVQLSKWESFGCSTAEAMLCECVPVVSNIASLPEVAGNCGFYIDRFSPKELADKIKEALNHPELGKLARKRIIEQFPLEKRREELLRVVKFERENV
jgi:glycosyltransferase involved in cell wall biosynthesis